MSILLHFCCACFSYLPYDFYLPFSLCHALYTFVWTEFYSLLQIMGGLVKSLNKAYNLFIEHHPDYSGPISLFAHSLGSVMCYDILTNWSPLTLYDTFVSNAVVRLFCDIA